MTPDEAIPEVELEVEDDADQTVYPDTLSCPEGQIHFGGDAQTFLIHWAGKMGYEDVSGSALLVGENLSLAIIHPETGKAMGLPDIAKAGKPTLSRVQ